MFNSAAVDVTSDKPAAGSPVQLVSVPAEGVPRFGVTNTAEVKSAFVLFDTTIASNSVSNNEPNTFLPGFPAARLSLAVKFVVLV